MEDVTLFGQTNFRSQKRKFGIKEDDRRRHTYVVGKTGVGKTTMLENMIITDIKAGRGVSIVDPHGELAEKILDFIPEERIKDVVYFNPPDMEFPIAFNPLEQIGTEYRHLVASGIMGVFKKIWPDVWSARMEYILNNSLLALLEFPGSTLLGIMRVLSEKEYRKKVVDNLKDPVVKSFWVNEFAKYTQRLESEATAAIQNKVGQFVTNPLVRNILGQPRSSINMRKIMDEGKILVVNLSKGKIGEDNSSLLGSMIVTKLQLSAMSRVNVPESERKDFYLYVDEFQNFATDSFANILSEARKYHLCLVLAHQYIGQLIHGDSLKVRDAVFGNVGTMVVYRVGAEDAEFLEKEFQPDFVANDLVNLPKYNFYTKLMIDGVTSRPFSAANIPPQISPKNNFRDLIIENSQKQYGTPRKLVEEKIAGEWVSEGGPVAEDKTKRREGRSFGDGFKPRSDFRREGFTRPSGGFTRPSDRPARPAEGSFHKPWRDRPKSFTPPKPFTPRPMGPVRPVDEPARPVGEPRPTMPLEQLKQSPVRPPERVRVSRPSPPSHEKKKVDIADLRKSLEEALTKTTPETPPEGLEEKEEKK